VYDTTALAKDPNYKVLIKRRDHVDEGHRGRRAAAHDSLLAPQDLGYSWSKMLRFDNIQFNSGGTFKLCFCDSTLTGNRCKSEKDFTVEVGKIHASGVSCLIAKPELQKVSCATQAHGGYRCYNHLSEAPMPKPPLIGPLGTKDGITTVWGPEKAEALYKPEEDGGLYVSGFQSTR